MHVDRASFVRATAAVPLAALLLVAEAGAADSSTVSSSPRVGSPDPTTIGSQYTIVGMATLNGSTLHIPDAYTALGTGFGNDFHPAEIRRKPWGRLYVHFIDCSHARFIWSSRGAGTAEFGSGETPIRRLMSNEATEQCVAAGGIDHAPNTLWLAGNWFADARSGEGLMFDVSGDGVVMVGWFTHRPAAQ